MELNLISQEHLLGLVHDAVLARNASGQILLWNRAAQTLYGWSEDEVRGKLSHQLLQTKFPEPFSRIQFALLNSGSWEGELTQTARDGRVVAVTSRWLVESAINGKPGIILESHREITEKRHLEEALRQAQADLAEHIQQRLAELETANEALLESQNRFQQMARSVRDVFWLSNPKMTSFIYVSPAFEKLWGRSCHSVYENPRLWFDSVHPEDRAWLQKFFAKALSERGYEHTYRVLRPDGSLRWILESGFPVKDDSGRFYRLAGIARDITRRKEMEIEVLSISEREQRRLGQDLHDDLCQQLVGIEFLSKALEQQLGTQPEAARAAEIARLIRAAIDRTRHLARGLVPLEAEPVGLMRALSALAARTSEIFCINCLFKSPAPALVSDVTTASHLYRIAQEAVTNSIKHGHADEIEIGLKQTADGLTLAISDNGVGISAAKRTDPGLGLNIMRYRADMIGGQLTIEPSAEGGTKVVCTVHLPEGKS